MSFKSMTSIALVAGSVLLGLASSAVAAPWPVPAEPYAENLVDGAPQLDTVAYYYDPYGAYYRPYGAYRRPAHRGAYYSPQAEELRLRRYYSPGAERARLNRYYSPGAERARAYRGY